MFWLGTDYRRPGLEKDNNSEDESEPYCTDPNTRVCNVDVSWYLPPEYNRYTHLYDLVEYGVSALV